jgi:signal transduction histidine kinase/ActR/RegA family two-component response regulator
MSIDPTSIRAEAHTLLGELIERDASLLIERWGRRAREEQPNAPRAHHAILVDHLPEFLRGLARSLAAGRAAASRADGDSPDHGEHAAVASGPQELGSTQHCLPAAFHGEQRWENGWSILEVVRDFQILRLVIFDYLEESLGRPLKYRETMAIGLALDDAIGASVAMYVKSRDQHLREAEARRLDIEKRTQEQLRNQAEILRQVDRRKSEFLATLGHELRNPLAPLWNAVQVLEMQETADMTLAQTRGIIKRQVQQLERLVDDLLDISRIAQDKIELRRELVDLSAVVTQAAQTSAPHVKARHHQMEVTLTPEPLFLEADPARLVQILVNLLNNAAKYSEPGGRIALRVRRDGKDAVISVRDNGIGIAPELLPHVFDLFTQADLTPEHAQGGMGIGLALVRRLVELHGGSIMVQSAGVGHGSEFVVRLPALTATPLTPVPAPSGGKAVELATTPVARRRILIVDDNVDAAVTFRMLLTEEGHDVHLAHDGPSALEKARSLKPEVVLLDIGMPRMDGHEVARRLRLDPAMERVLLIALTGYGQDEDRRRSKESGFNAHLVKPVDLDALQTLLLHWNEAAVRPAR